MLKYKVVIVNYNKAKLVGRLLQQLKVQTIPPVAVAIVDNSPYCYIEKDIMKIEDFNVELSHFPRNLGYSKACNLGCKGDWDYVVFLNPDIEISNKSLFEKLLEKVQTVKDLGCAGVVQRNPDGTYERVARKFPSLFAILGKRVPFFKWLARKSVANYLESYPCDYMPASDPIKVDWLQSSFLIVPKQVWRKCGGFDERFFVFMADTEYGARCRRNDLNSYLFRDLKVEADGLRSSAGGVVDVFRKRTIRIHLMDAFRYYTGF